MPAEAGSIKYRNLAADHSAIISGAPREDPFLRDCLGPLSLSGRSQSCQHKNGELMGGSLLAMGLPGDDGVRESGEREKEKRVG